MVRQRPFCCDLIALIAATGGLLSCGQDAPSAIDEPSQHSDVIVLSSDAQQQRPKLVMTRSQQSAATPEEAARDFLSQHATQLDLVEAIDDLSVTAERRGLAGRYVRLQQHVEGLPVFGGEVVVLVGEASGVFAAKAANLAHYNRGSVRKPTRDIGRAAAERIATRNAPTAGTRVANVELGLAGEHDFRRVYRVDTVGPSGDWRVLIDAATGERLSLEDRRRYVTGSGKVFDPNPVASTGNASLTDNNDADSTALDNARYDVSLPRLDGTTYLKGSYVDVRPPIISNRASSATHAFDYTRNDNRFEEVMIYFHIDRAQNRIQGLGLNDVNNRQQIATANFDTNDNSFYSPGSKELFFGQGGVDDAEDADVILHEYGHSILDNQVPGFGGGDEGAIGEGFADYLAASFNDTLSPETTSPACIAEWDATAYGTCRSRVDSTNHYPEAEVEEVHADGEMWSSAAFRVRDSIGANIMDTLMFESNFLLSTSETFADVVDALIATDQTLYAGAHVATLKREFNWQGLSRILSTPASFPLLASEVVSIENPKASGLYANNLDDIQVYQSPGASALRVHFSQIATAAGSGCFANSCDNIYLYDEDRDLYQVLNGTASDVTSVQIPGDTVRIRLVTNASGTAAGYTIDRVDVMGVALEAGVDAGAPADAASEAGTAEPNDGSVGDPPDASGGNPIDASSGSPDGSAGAGATDSGSTLDAGNSAGTNGGGAAGMPSANGGAGAASMPQGGNPGTNPDASTGAPDASTPTDSGIIAQTETASGCDCRLAGGTAHRGDPSASQPLAFLALLLTLRRRRRMR